MTTYEKVKALEEKIQNLLIEFEADHDVEIVQVDVDTRAFSNLDVSIMTKEDLG